METSPTANRFGILIIVEDERALSVLTQIQKRLPVYLQAACVEAAGVFKEEVRKSMVEQTATSRPNTYATLVNKQNIDLRPLFDTQSLYNSLKEATVTFSMNGDVGMIGATYSFSPPGAGQDVYMDGQQRKDPGYIYLWSHEFGTRRPSWKFGIKQWGTFVVPKRPFLMKGLRKGYRKAHMIIFSAIYNAIDIPERAIPTKAFPKLNMEREFRIHEWDLIMAVAPPTRLYAILGAGADAISFVKGDFMQANMEAFGMSMAKGRTGMTKKVQRRGFRRRLWR